MADPLEVRMLLQKAATTGNGNAVDMGGLGRKFTAYIEGSTGVAAGAVQLETARTPDYAGTWAAIGSPVTVGDGETKIVQFDGPVLAVRARISTNVTSGTVTVELVGN